MKLIYTIFLALILVIQIQSKTNKNKSVKKNKNRKQIGITAGTPAPFSSETKVLPILSGVKPPIAYPLTLEPENGKNTGRHSNF